MLINKLNLLLILGYNLLPCQIFSQINSCFKSKDLNSSIKQIQLTKNMTESANQEPLVVNIKQNPEPILVESLCISCGANGQTILMFTKIPFFKEMLIGSFSCDDCGNRNNEVNFVGELPSRGISIKFKVTEKSDLNREVVKSEHASIRFEELDLELPETNRADINTIQGILLKVESNLSKDQEERKLVDYESYLKIQSFVEKIRDYREGKVLPFTVHLYDPSGHSNIKNPFAPKLDDRLFITYFTRTQEQILSMGYSLENAKEEMNSKISTQQKQKIESQQDKSFKKVDFNNPVTEADFMHNQASNFEVPCHSCLMPGLMKLCQTNIPHFSDLIIMSFSCDYCGAHSTDTKTSGVITDKSTNITLNAKQIEDLKRDLYKSQSCCVKIPEIQLELDYGTLGGAYTTVEGLLEKIKNHMQDLNGYSDSDDDFTQKIKNIIATLDQFMSGDKKFTLILDDPLSNSFLRNPYHPEQDKNAVITVRERTEDQNDFLGINQMSV